MELTIEASMRAREAILVAIITVDVEFTDAVHALELLEAIQWHLAGSGDKLE